MDRKEFIKKTCQIGVVSSCASLCAVTASSDLFADDDKKKSSGTDSKETPCNEKVDFAKNWAKRFFDQLDQNIDEPTRIKLMISNGKACYRGAYGDQHKAQDGKNHIEEFMKNYEKWTGVKDAVRIEGDVIHYQYVGNPKGLKTEDGYCLCPLLEDGPKEISRTYCYCSVGYVTEMFKDITSSENVKVELKESVRTGGKRCKFEIKVG